MTRVSHTDKIYKILTEETGKRTEKDFNRFIIRSPSMKAHIGQAKEYGHYKATQTFPGVQSGTQNHENALRYALCYSIIHIRNTTMDSEDKFDIITILIKDWRFGYRLRIQEQEARAIRKDVMKKVAKKVFRYPSEGGSK